MPSYGPPGPVVFSPFEADIAAAPLTYFAPTFITVGFFSGGPPGFRVVEVLPTAPTAEPDEAWVVPADDGFSLA